MRYIDAEELRPKLTWLNEYDYLHVLSIIKSFPTVDIDAVTENHEKIGYDKGYRDGYAQATVEAEPVVRCKDCWVFHQDETWNHKKGLCGWFDMPVGVNDFCSMGDRREDAEPVKHGHNAGGRYFTCSECGYVVNDLFEGSTSKVYLFEDGKDWNYCPHCGAKMDEVEDGA